MNVHPDDSQNAEQEMIRLGAKPIRLQDVAVVNTDYGPLLTDRYQLTMLQAYWQHGMHETAVFEFFVRRLPAQRNFLVAAGLDQALAYLEESAFSPEDIEWLAQTQHFQPGLPALA